jgi:hypothetical protein
MVVKQQKGDGGLVSGVAGFFSGQSLGFHLWCDGVSPNPVSTGNAQL